MGSLWLSLRNTPVGELTTHCVSGSPFSEEVLEEEVKTTPCGRKRGGSLTQRSIRTTTFPEEVSLCQTTGLSSGGR